MKMFESQILSVLLHGAFLIFVVFYFVPPKAIDVGQGMMLELIEGKSPKGLKVRAPKVAKAKKEILSKPVVIATKPKVKKVLKKPTPGKIPMKAPTEKVQKVAVITQKDPTFIKKPINHLSAQVPKAKPFVKPQIKNVDPAAKIVPKDAINPVISRSTGRKPAPPAAAPIVGEKKYSLAEALGKANGVVDARKRTQIPGNLPPSYPTSDRLDNKEGKVTLLAYINAGGGVEDIKVENSTGSFLMEAESIRSFSRYKFSKNQPGWVRMPFEFQLKGPAKELHANFDGSDSLKTSLPPENSGATDL